MSVIIRYPLKIQNVISEIKSQEAYVVTPAFFGFTYASQIIKGVISAPRERFLELEKLVNSKEETAGVEKLPLSVIPLIHRTFQRDSNLPPYPDMIRKCITEAFAHNVRDHKKTIMYFITGDYYSRVDAGLIHSIVEDVAKLPEFKDEVDEIRITYEPYVGINT